MARFTELKNIQYLPTDGDWYRITGILTEEDIKKINLFPRKTILVIENTSGLTSEIISKITSDNIMFSVTGGLDHFNKDKFKKSDYVERTLMSPKGLTRIIKYYEEIESHMQPEWTDTQKCMFLYDCLTKDFRYENYYKTPLKKGVAERSLNGILYKKLVCSGFAMVFKEGLDRLNIKNYYQNKQNEHSWNIVQLDGKFRGIELTWECYNKSKFKEGHDFYFFGRNPDFYNHTAHKITNEVYILEPGDEYELWKEMSLPLPYEEQEYDLEVFKTDELRKNYQVIASAINKRKTNSKMEFESKKELIQCLPIDRIRLKMQKQCKEEYNYQMLYNFLKENNILSKEIIEQLTPLFKIRKGLILDVINTNHITSFTGKEIGVESEKLNACEFYSDGNYITPFGMKLKFRNMENVTDKNHKKEVFEILIKRLLEYTANYLVDLINNVENIIAEYEETNNLTDNPDLNISIKQANLYSKLNVILNCRDLCSLFNIPQELVDKKIKMIEKYLNSKKYITKLTEEERKEKAIDFLYETFSDEKETKKICEQYEGHSLTNEEWHQKRTDINYIMKVFDKLKNFNIPKEYIQEVLNNIYSERKNIVKK